MSGTYTLPCGCVALTAFERWVSMCAKHEQEWVEHRARVTADDRARRAVQS